MASGQGEKEFKITVGKATVSLALAMGMLRTGMEGVLGEHCITPSFRRAPTAPRAFSADTQTSAYLIFKLLK